MLFIFNIPAEFVARRVVARKVVDPFGAVGRQTAVVVVVVVVVVAVVNIQAVDPFDVAGLRMVEAIEHKSVVRRTLERHNSVVAVVGHIVVTSVGLGHCTPWVAPLVVAVVPVSRYIRQLLGSDRLESK